MSKLNTKDVKASGAGIAKTLQPGNIACKIHGIELEDFKFKEGAYHLLLSLESGPIEGFDGFLVDKDKPEGPKYKGQVGTVKASEWAFADGETKGGKEISRDQEIMKFLKNICVAIDKVKWLDSQDNKHETIESLVKAFNKEKPFKDILLDFCLCGKEYMNKNNFINYELFLPKFSKVGSPFAAIKAGAVSKVIVFNVDDHIKRKKVEASQSLEDQASSEMNIPEGTQDFEL